MWSPFFCFNNLSSTFRRYLPIPPQFSTYQTRTMETYLTPLCEDIRKESYSSFAGSVAGVVIAKQCSTTTIAQIRQSLRRKTYLYWELYENPLILAIQRGFFFGDSIWHVLKKHPRHILHGVCTWWIFGFADVRKAKNWPPLASVFVRFWSKSLNPPPPIVYGT